MDATLRWKPLRRSIYNSFVGRSEVIWSRREDPNGVQSGMGFYVSADYQFARRWFAGVRFDGSDRAYDADPARHRRLGDADVLAERVQPGPRTGTGAPPTPSVRRPTSSCSSSSFQSARTARIRSRSMKGACASRRHEEHEGHEEDLVQDCFFVRLRELRGFVMSRRRYNIMIRKLFVLALGLLLAPGIARAQSKLNVITTTEDLASIAREVGGDRVAVEAIARGYQDPHFVEAKPSFILKLQKADLLIVVGRELEIGWLPPLVQQSRNGKIQPGAAGYLDASLGALILEMPTGQITRAMGDVHPLGNPHYWMDPENGKRIAKAVGRRVRPAPAGRSRVLRTAAGRLHGPPGRRREAVAGDDGALQGDQGRHLPPVVSELRRAVRPGDHRLRRAAAGHSADAAAHARPDERDETAEREARAGRAVLRS